MSQVLSAEEHNEDAPASQHLAPTEAEFNSLCSVISNLGDEDFEKVLHQRRIHLEEKRLSAYLASSNSSQFRSLDVDEDKSSLCAHARKFSLAKENMKSRLPTPNKSVITHFAVITQLARKNIPWRSLLGDTIATSMICTDVLGWT